MTARRTRRHMMACLAGGVGLATLKLPVCPAWAENAPNDRARGAPQEVAWLAEAQRKPESLPADAPQLAPVLVDEHGARITTLQAWQAHRRSIRRAWVDWVGLWDRPPATPPAFEVLDQDHADGVVRQRVRYETEPDFPCEAYLLRPAEANGARPGIVVFHSTIGYSIRQPAGLEGPPERWFGLDLARQGYITWCPRNFLWPENQKMAIAEQLARLRKRHPHAKGMAKMLFDALVAVDILANLPGVDPNRLGAIGHSLGAKEVLYLAAFDERIRASVSSEGGIGTRFSNWHDPWYLGEEIRGAGFRREHQELLALVAPRAFLCLGSA